MSEPSAPGMVVEPAVEEARQASAPGRPAASGWSRAWVVVIVGLAVAASASVFLDLPAPIRPLATIGFVLLAPGIAVARLFRLESRLAEFTLGFGLSVAIAGLVTAVILYMGMWNSTRALLILLLVAVGALALDRDLVPSSAWRQLWHAARGRARYLAGKEGGPATQSATPPATAPTPAALGSAPIGAAAGATAPGPVSTSSAQAPATLPPFPAMPATRHAPETMPPPPLAVVRRGPRRSPVATTPTRVGGKRATIGVDPLDGTDVHKRLRSTIDRVIDDLADRRDAPPS